VSQVPERDPTIFDALEKALSLVDQAGKAKGSDDKSSYLLLLWRSAAEAEYAAFLISTAHGLMDYDPNAANNPGADDPRDDLDTARELLRGAQSSLQNEPRRAYEAVRNSVSVLRKMYAVLDKPLERLGVASSPPLKKE
jgi:hypothetical protein